MYHFSRHTLKHVYRAALVWVPKLSCSDDQCANTVQPQLSVPLIIRTLAPGKIQGQGTKQKARDRCTHVHQLFELFAYLNTEISGAGQRAIEVGLYTNVCTSKSLSLNKLLGVCCPSIL